MASRPTTGSVKVNLHCHSNLSDGDLSPEELAERLAAAGVRHASLTDHDTFAGVPRFQAALSRHGIGCLPGIELCAKTAVGDGHFLVYGIDPTGSVAGELVAAAKAPAGPPPFARLAETAHRGRGRIFLAHPFTLAKDKDSLRAAVATLKTEGLDGIEAIYAPYTQAQILDLLDIAKGLGLPVSAGTDFHSAGNAELSDRVVNMPVELWRQFRAGLFETEFPSEYPRPRPEDAARSGRPRSTLRGFVLRILLPTLLALGILILPVFTYVLPRFESALYGRKLETIQELTRSACSILQEYQDDVAAGRLALPEAQKAAAARIQFLRYGKDGKDYFWITDLAPRMIMHPYRADLNGQDLSTFTDAQGKRLFVEFARLAREKREGTLEYLWQWKDDAGRLAPKESYVRLYEPWGWVVGTGLYLDDVRAQIAEITSRVAHVAVGIALMVSLLLLFVADQSYRIERRRRRAEQALRDSHERYRTVVEASKEGSVLVVGGRSVFANQTLLSLLDYGEAQWALLDLDEIFLPGDGTFAEYLAGIANGAATPEPTEMQLLRRDGGRITAQVTPERVQVGGRDGLILLVRDLRGQKRVQAALDDIQARFRGVAENLNVAIFRVRLDDPMTLVEANRAARDLLGDRLDAEGLAAVLGGAAEDFRRRLLDTGTLRDLPVRRGRRANAPLLALSATLVRDDAGAPAYADAIALDATLRHTQSNERESLLADFQSALSFLNEPVSRSMRDPVALPLSATVSEAAAAMTRAECDVLLARTDGGDTVGIVTDHDLRTRVLAKSVDPGRPLFEIMSSPVLSVAPNTEGHEALEKMREEGVHHLAVRDAGGRVVGVLHGRDLLRVDQYPLALFTRAIKEASRPEDVAIHRGRLPAIIAALIEGGARPRHICRSISAISDSVASKLLAFAEARLGPPPAPYAFLVLGSQGREEQTLVSDQDTAIVHAGEDSDAARAYLLALGREVSAGLEAAGLPMCKGGMMAKNPKWCQSLATWQGYFSHWIDRGEPKELLHFSTFFDFRHIRGSEDLAVALRAHVSSKLAGADAFLGHLARECLQYRPPLGFFGNIVAGTDERGHRTFNAKDSMAFIVNLARLYALKNGIEETSTYDRLRRLSDLGVLSANGYDGLVQAHDFLLTLRLRHQAARLVAGAEPDNDIELGTLSDLETATLKHVFAHITTIQKKAGMDFLGTG